MTHKTISVELQNLFDYGTNNENNALATLLGTILTVYFPTLSHREDGCEIVPLGDSYAVISGGRQCRKCRSGIRI